MRTLRYLIGASIVALLPLTAAAQSLTVGNDVDANTTDNNISAIRTDIDLVNPANATGSVSSVSVSWDTPSCANAVKIKFFRRNGDNLTLIAERGPFNISSTRTTITLSPAVDVQQGDLIGLARVANCGNPGAQFGAVTEGYLQYPSDVTGSVVVRDAAKGRDVLAIVGTGSATERVARIIPTVASAPGVAGSYFRTAVQLFNPQANSSLTGKLVFHPAGHSGAANDPSLPYSLVARQVRSYTDIVGSMGQTGLGSIDVVVPQGQPAPVVIVRVFNDAGGDGTAGFTEELIDPQLLTVGVAKHLVRGSTGYLVTPPDATRSRFNIGVRSLSSGVTLTATLRDVAGQVVKTVTKTYAPNWFEQTSFIQFFDEPLGPSMSVQLSVTAGGAIVYGSTTDNITNDPAVQFAVTLSSNN